MTALAHCEICGRLGPLGMTASLLDPYSYNTCQSCLANHAEDWRAIGNYLREAEWNDLPPEIADVVTVWMDENYIPVAEGVKRMLERQLVPVEPEWSDDDEAEFQQINRVWKQMAAPHSEVRRRRRRFSDMVMAVVLFFLDWKTA